MLSAQLLFQTFSNTAVAFVRYGQTILPGISWSIHSLHFQRRIEVMNLFFVLDLACNFNNFKTC